MEDFLQCPLRMAVAPSLCQSCGVPVKRGMGQEGVDGWMGIHGSKRSWYLDISWNVRQQEILNKSRLTNRCVRTISSRRNATSHQLVHFCVQNVWLRMKLFFGKANNPTKFWYQVQSVFAKNCFDRVEFSTFKVLILKAYFQVLCPVSFREGNTSSFMCLWKTGGCYQVPSLATLVFRDVFVLEKA